MQADEKQGLIGHLIKFKKSLIRSVIALVVGFCIAYYFSDEVLSILSLPLRQNMGPEGKLIYTGLTEMFFIYVKVGFFFGLVIAAPYIFYEIWTYISPSLRPEQKRYILSCLFFSCLLFTGGLLFGYFLVFPLAFKFFLGFANEQITALPSIKEYLSLTLKLLLAFGIVFEVPVIVFFLARVGIVTVDGFRKNRKYAILLAFIVGAILTPPDVISQCMMAIPLILLYEVGIIVAMISGKKNKKI
jgi:sec-independent protein translocase protein TatC